MISISIHHPKLYRHGHPQVHHLMLVILIPKVIQEVQLEAVRMIKLFLFRHC